MLTLKPDWDQVQWKEMPTREFFGEWKGHPVVKIVFEERTYILPACGMSPFYRAAAIDIIEGKEQRGIILP